MDLLGYRFKEGQAQFPGSIRKTLRGQVRANNTRIVELYRLFGERPALRVSELTQHDWVSWRLNCALARCAQSPLANVRSLVLGNPTKDS
jgi:hypothetical protein